MPGFDQVPFGDLQALEAAITPETGGILLEPVQGEGGIIPAPEDYLCQVRKIADAHGLLLFFDEIQTGMGRTGKLFAYENCCAVPDILASAKGLGGGFPIGACLATQHAASGMTYGTHGSTYGGNPLGTHIAGVVLDEVLKPGFLANVKARGEQLGSGLLQLTGDVFPTVRGVGLMQGMVCRDNNMDVATALIERGLLVIPAGGNVIRFIPPLIVTEDDVNTALSIVADYRQSVL
jgi:acetylornithine/N-succinyldiaminopimelate aminotransferase